jgi:phage terminase large subunit
MNINQLEELMEDVNLLDLRIELFKQGNFDFIVEGIANNSEGDWNDGEISCHKKQKQALEILTDNDTGEFLYGGAAGGAKTWTGVCWIVFSAMSYSNTNWFIARNQLKDLLGSVYKTFREVCRTYGITDFKFNAVKNYIEFPNGSMINFIEVSYKPSDPLYEDLGSTEFTSGWLEEVGEIHEMAVIVLGTRIGRSKNKEHGLKKKLFMTCNPKQNWAKTKFYDKHKNGQLEIENKILLPNGRKGVQRKYLNCLVTENPFIDQDYIDGLMAKALEHKPTYERLFLGNWDYEDNPYQLAEQEMIEQVFDNNHVQKGVRCITADVARFGSDKAQIGYWDGWNLVQVISLDISKTTDVELAIQTLRFKYKVPKNRVVVDDDGVGGGVTDGVGAKGFKNNGKPIKLSKDTPNYKNLQVQCLYMLAEKINEGGLNISADLTPNEKEEIKSELAQIQAKGEQDPERKLDCKSKGDIKADIGRSPDWRDMIMMRVFLDLKKQRRPMVSSRKRSLM